MFYASYNKEMQNINMYTCVCVHTQYCNDLLKSHSYIRIKSYIFQENTCPVLELKDHLVDAAHADIYGKWRWLSTQMQFQAMKLSL